MRSALFGKSDFFLRIKRKPAQEDLYQKVIRGELSDEEIANCGQPLWVREALTEIKQRGGKTQWQCVDEVIAQAEAAQVKASQQVYPVYEWTRGTHLVVPPKGFDLEILTGEWFLVDRPRGQVKVDYTLLNLEPAIIDELVAAGKYLGSFTDPDFIENVTLRKKRS